MNNKLVMFLITMMVSIIGITNLYTLNIITPDAWRTFMLIYFFIGIICIPEILKGDSEK